jgi:hypothetical protein
LSIIGTFGGLFLGIFLSFGEAIKVIKKTPNGIKRDGAT